MVESNLYSNPNTIQQEIFRLLVDTLNIDEDDLAPNAHWRNDLGADSLDIAEIIVALGQRFTVQIRDSDVGQIQTIDEAVAYINGLT
ncbi:MAG: acyl carrier protein [Chloroflexota bacterium]